MTLSIVYMKKRIELLESLIESQSSAYAAGYLDALRDNGVILSDVSFEDLATEYKTELMLKCSYGNTATTTIQ